MRTIIRASIVAAGLACGMMMLASVRLSANGVPEPCDFITGGGFVLGNTLNHANFGVHGGCKHGSFWGHLNYVDHAGFLLTVPYHVQSTDITGYFMDVPNARTICGIATTNAGETVRFRVRMQDNEGLGIPDLFEIQLSNGYIVTTRPLEGGNIELHKGNASTTPPLLPPDAATICPGIGTGGGGPPE